MVLGGEYMTVHTKWNRMLAQHPIRVSLNILEESLAKAKEKTRRARNSTSELEKYESEDILEEVNKASQIVKHFSDGLKK